MDSSRSGPRSTAVVTVLFCDLVASTERQSRLGDDAADHFRRGFFGALRAAVVEHHGEEVKNLGDGLMVVFRESAAAAVACAAAMHDRVAPLDLDDSVRLRIGMSVGEAGTEDGDWFGTPVVEAARLCSAAEPDQTLATETVRALVGTRGGFRFRSVGPRSLKGLPAPIAVVELIRDVDPEAPGEAVPPAPVERARDRAPRRRLVLAGGLVVLAVAAVAVFLGSRGGDDPGASGGVPAAPGYPVRYDELAHCPQYVVDQMPEATCGRLTVPENRAEPSKGTVKLAVTRAPARNGTADRPTVLDFGSGGLATSPLRDRAEQIDLSQRGWHESDPFLTCPGFAATAGSKLVTSPLHDKEAEAAGIAALRECRQAWTAKGVDLGMYNYAEAGLDMLDLMRALHLKQVDVVAGFNSALSALTLLREAPDAVRTLSLETPLRPGQSTVSDPTAVFAQAFRRYADLCRRDDACNRAYPDLAGALRAEHLTNEATPRLATGENFDGKKYQVRLDGDRIGVAVAAALGNPDALPLLAAGVGRASDELTASQVVNWYGWLLDPQSGVGAVLSYGCTYDDHTRYPGRELSEGQLAPYRGIDDGILRWACPVWDVPQGPDELFYDTVSEVPTLIVNSALTPDFSLDWADGLRSRLPHATALTMPTLTGAVFYNANPPCIGDIRRRFQADPAARLPVAACERESPPIRFVAEL